MAICKLKMSGCSFFSFILALQCKLMQFHIFHLKQVPLWMQKSAKDPLAPVVWVSFLGCGGTPLYGLNGEVRPDKVWFFRGFCLERGIDFINFCLKQGIVTRPYAFIN